MAEPVSTLYGKSAVTVYRVRRDRLFAGEINLMIGGDVFIPSYTEGDNSMVVATDSMKNFIHTVALDHTGDTLEDLLREIGTKFLDRYEHVDVADLHARELVFARRSEVVHQRLYDDYATARVRLPRGSEIVERSGRKSLHLVKLEGSSFADFVRDEHTTLPDAYDRPLFVHLDVEWRNEDVTNRVDGLAIRESIVDTFAGFESASIQHLVHEMGTRALEQFPGLASISFEAQNRLWDTARSSEAATVYTDARPPFGVIQLTLRR